MAWDIIWCRHTAKRQLVRVSTPSYHPPNVRPPAPKSRKPKARSLEGKNFTSIKTICHSLPLHPSPNPRSNHKPHAALYVYFVSFQSHSWYLCKSLISSLYYSRSRLVVGVLEIFPVLPLHRPPRRQGTRLPVRSPLTCYTTIHNVHSLLTIDLALVCVRQTSIPL